MELSYAIILCFTTAIISAAVGILLGSRGKIDKIAHSKYCPENRNVILQPGHDANCPVNRNVLTEEAHDKDCELKLKPIRDEIITVKRESTQGRRIVEAIAIKLQVPIPANED